MQPRRQQRVRIDVRSLVELHAMLAQQLLQPPCLKAATVSVVPPIHSPAMNNCGMVLLPLRAARTERIRPPRSSTW
jgi:hypothetical protein